MTNKLIFAFLFTLSTLCAYSQVPLIRATSNQVKIKDGDKPAMVAWTLNPESNPDVYATVADGKKKVTFYTDIDSISFEVKAGKKYDFIILLNKKDSCRTQIDVIKEIKPATFSSAYIRKNKGHFSFEIPEVQELVHIIIALTPKGLSDRNMVNHDTEYYTEVLQHFEAYKNDPIIAVFDKLARSNYSHIKMDACGFYFDGNTIKKDNTYDRLNWGPKNFITPHIKELEEFAKKSGFRDFYKSHKAYYDSLLALMEQQLPIQAQWDWLQQNFPSRYDNYRLTFSPLVRGSHSTNHFETGDFKQTVMFIAGPNEKPEFNEKITEGLMTRMVFTEIDHNYVNPISDKYLTEIDTAFAKRAVWAKKGSSADSYSGQYMVFNEYMTWAVFSVYAKERYNQEDFKVINAWVENFMINKRGFVNFDKFNAKMIELYQNKPKNTTIPDLYPAILEWAALQ